MRKEEVRVPKRLRIKPHMSIDGIRPGKRLYEGLYLLGKNMTRDEAIRLSSPEFDHCIEILADKPKQEALATDGELPKSTAGYRYSREKAHKAELEAWEREHGTSVHKPPHLDDAE